MQFLRDLFSGPKSRDTLDFVCLANSWKYGGRCVAGLRLDGGGWIRPVSDAPHGALLVQHYGLPHGDEPRILDCLRIEVGRPRPEPHQPENLAIGAAPWQRLRPSDASSTWDLLEQTATNEAFVLGDAADRIDFDRFEGTPASASLSLVKPDTVRFELGRTPQFAGRVLAHFSVSRVHYALPVTDPVWSRMVLRVAESERSHERSKDVEYLVVSLTDPLDGVCWKVVSGVVARPRER